MHSCQDQNQPYGLQVMHDACGQRQQQHHAQQQCALVVVLLDHPPTLTQVHVLVWMSPQAQALQVGQEQSPDHLKLHAVEPAAQQPPLSFSGHVFACCCRHHYHHHHHHQLQQLLLLLLCPPLPSANASCPSA
jgi:hypothetical protein